MARFYPIGATGGGAGSDDCTATAAELLKGYTGILKGSDDEPVQGSLELTGNAQAAHRAEWRDVFIRTMPKANRLAPCPTVAITTAGATARAMMQAISGCGSRFLADITTRTPMCSCHGRISATWRGLRRRRSKKTSR